MHLLHLLSCVRLRLSGHVFAFLLLYGRPGADPVDTSPAARLRPSLDDSSQLAFLRDRVRSLEKELLGMRGHADVWKSKPDRGAAREEYLMAELLRLSEQLQCKFFELLPISLDAPAGLASYFFASIAGANLAPREEKERVVVRVNCLTQQDMEAGGF